MALLHPVSVIHDDMIQPQYRSRGLSLPIQLTSFLHSLPFKYTPAASVPASLPRYY